MTTKYQIRLPEDYEKIKLFGVPDKDYNAKSTAYRLWFFIYMHLPNAVAREFEKMVAENPFLAHSPSEEEENDAREAARRVRTGSL